MAEVVLHMLQSPGVQRRVELHGVLRGLNKLLARLQQCFPHRFTPCLFGVLAGFLLLLCTLLHLLRNQRLNGLVALLLLNDLVAVILAGLLAKFGELLLGCTALKSEPSHKQQAYSRARAARASCRGDVTPLRKCCHALRKTFGEVMSKSKWPR